jgi:formamidopyrimidine-DNA glycosylase
MTGNLLYGASERPYVRARLLLDDDAALTYTDLRRFGTWQVFDDDAALRVFLDARLGPEPLDGGVPARELGRRLAGRRAPVKALLLDQRVVAGVGNIYADEALHRARIHPETAGGAVARPALGRLAEALSAVLAQGIEAQGASIRDYRTPAGGYGSMQERFAVFDREGQPCPRCGTAIVKLRVAGRGTYVCPRCQRRRRA